MKICNAGGVDLGLFGGWQGAAGVVGGFFCGEGERRVSVVGLGDLCERTFSFLKDLGLVFLLSLFPFQLAWIFILSF